jgi:hypothetical protein
LPDNENEDTDDIDSDEDENVILELPAKPIPLPLELGPDMPSHRNPTNLQPRCGLTKVKVVKLLQMMICCRYDAIDSMIVELGLLSKLWTLFFLHERNNTLHCAVTHATLDILEGTSTVLKHELLTKPDGCNLVARILDSFALNDARLSSGKSRLCYMGQLSMCAFEIVRSSDTTVLEALKNSGARWEHFQHQTLDTLVQLDQQQLGDPVPMPVVSDDAQDHQMLLENLTAILSSLRLSSSN